MKITVFIRHAKAVHYVYDSEYDDFDRPLTDRGEREAHEVGVKLAALAARPDLIVASSAQRTLQTAQAIAEAVQYPASEIKTAYRLYEATMSDFFDVIQQLDEAVQTVFIVGHNPGVWDCIAAISGEELCIPTAAVIGIELDIKQWSEIRGAHGVIAFKIFPEIHTAQK
ncbi:MAG: histidine phosphatase family protein [Bacteroidales bacterium]|jgi:phosphohistidine phosphatase|nr:histidine phosphatase family protein [Bacteroidales bacterium]